MTTFMGQGRKKKRALWRGSSGQVKTKSSSTSELCVCVWTSVQIAKMKPIGQWWLLSQSRVPDIEERPVPHWDLMICEYACISLCMCVYVCGYDIVCVNVAMITRPLCTGHRHLSGWAVWPVTHRQAGYQYQQVWSSHLCSTILSYNFNRWS